MHAIKLEQGYYYKLYGNDYRTILSRALTDRIESELVELKTGDVTPNHTHSDLEQVFIVIDGKVRLDIGGETKDIDAPSIAYVPRNKEHRVTALEDSKYVFVSCWHDRVAPIRTEEELRAYEKKLVNGDLKVPDAQRKRAGL
ncbi:MAG TPA: cupin domain-containing protein [Candidatus Methylomirabilis sp.]|nr:cupin domain-containing protein [Candidatus Methylomirabilis sp.]